jgi:DNA-binding NtrC family response regulator/Tfp pilus assembly protein PilF
MKSTNRAVLDKAQRFLRVRRVSEAITLLEKLTSADLNKAERARAGLLKAEAYIYQGNYDCSQDLEYALAYYRKSSANNNFAKAKFLQGKFLIALGRHFEAREELLEAYATYKRYGLSIDQAHVLNMLSLISFQVGEVDAAVRQLEQCIILYESCGDKKRAIMISANLGLLLYSMGRLGESTRIYESIKADIVKQGPQNCGLFYYQSAVVQGLKGNFGEAKNTIRMAIPNFDDYPREQAIYYENLGWIHLLAGEYAEAEESLLKGLEISLRIAPESALVSQIKRRLGDACFGLGKYDQARKYTDEALIVAEKINERVEIAACYRIYAQLECKNGSHDKARDWYKKACDIFSMIGSRYELATTRYLAAISGAYQNGERQALLYLAREYFESEDVRPYVEKINAELARVRSIRVARTVSSENGEPPQVIAVNPAMTRLVELARHVAPSDMSVLLTGPTGTGKDLLAQYIHYHSGRAGKFVSINAAAIPEGMIESELFGYKKGAYTGADKATRGLFEEADRGTLYLNEIADASPELQAKLLDVLETKIVRRLGERTERKIDFRLIAATNHDIEQLIREERFRLDLYHRLNEIPIALPALADRFDDIPALAEHFLRREGMKFDTASDEFHQLADRLTHRAWPGNVRQFEAEVKRLMLVSGGDVSRMIGAVDVAPSERERLLAILNETGWNRREAARRMGVSESTVRKWIEKYGLIELQSK